jgi:hypothetical protein
MFYKTQNGIKVCRKSKDHTAFERLVVLIATPRTSSGGYVWLRVYKKPYLLGCKYHFTSSMEPFFGLLRNEDNNLTLEEAQAKVLVSVRNSVRYWSLYAK